MEKMTVADVLSTIRVGEQTVLDLAGDGKDKTIKVEARRLLPEEPRPPKRAESPARAHVFLSASSLAAYLARYGSEKTVVYADPETETIHSVLDEESGSGFEVLQMRPQAHPLWAPWAARAGKSMDVRDLAKFVLENRRAVVSPDGRELAMTLSQIRAAVEVEIMAGRGQNAVNGLVVRSRIQSGQEQSSVVELPDTIRLRVPLYVDTAPREIEMDLLAEASSDGDVSVLLTSGTELDVRVRAFEEMVAQIRSALGETRAVVVFGRPAHKAWAYLQEMDARPASRS